METVTLEVNVTMVDVLRNLVDNPEDYTIIKKSEYEDLLDNQLFLNCLESGGVDNWDWYEEAMNEYLLQKEEMVNEN